MADQNRDNSGQNTSNTQGDPSQDNSSSKSASSGSSSSGSSAPPKPDSVAKSDQDNEGPSKDPVQEVGRLNEDQLWELRSRKPKDRRFAVSEHQ